MDRSNPNHTSTPAFHSNVEHWLSHDQSTTAPVSSITPGTAIDQTRPPSSKSRSSSRSTASSRTATSGSSASERLRLVELERDELRRAMEEERARAKEMQILIDDERAIADRLRREGAATPSGLSAKDALYRASQLKLDMSSTFADAPKRSTDGLFKSVCSTDLLFLMDTTGSMESYIEAAKEQVRSIVRDIRTAFFNDAEIRMAVVSYKDHGDNPNIQFLDFTPSVEQVHAFLNTLSATGGDDTPEDVLGGLQQAINASWKQQTRCIIHIADAPPHGRQLQNQGSDVPTTGSYISFSDRYAVPGSEPHGLTYKPLLQRLTILKINYALLRINDSTDRMAHLWAEEYHKALAECKLLPTNMFYNISSVGRPMRSWYRQSTSKQSAKGGLLFEEANLGIEFSSLRHLVVNMVTSSASRTAVRSTTTSSGSLSGGWTPTSSGSPSGGWTPKSSGSPSGGRTPNRGKMSWNLGDIREDDNDGAKDTTKLEKTKPKWDEPAWFDETLAVEGFSPDVVIHDTETLNQMMAHDDNIMMSITELTIRKRSQPFAEGAMRLAYYACTAASTSRFVVKSSKKRGKRLAHYAEDMRCQALCNAFALDFNAFSGDAHSINFIVTTCLKGKSGGADSSEDCISLEPFIEGNYVKYSSNSGYVNPVDSRINQVAQAFSHFTFERSKGTLLVTDLQGVSNTFTDPAIHSLDPERFKLADTNLGKEGFKFFFTTHVCNEICAKLGLQSNGSMVASGNYVFRQKWRRVDNTVCCSNQLCGKILRLADAHRSYDYPDYHWCGACLPQLRAFTTTLLCVAPGPTHEFDVSQFFYQSQGRRTPRRCQDHRDEDEIICSPAAEKSRPVVFRRTDEATPTFSTMTIGTAVNPTSSTVNQDVPNPDSSHCFSKGAPGSASGARGCTPASVNSESPAISSSDFPLTYRPRNQRTDENPSDEHSHLPSKPKASYRAPTPVSAIPGPSTDRVPARATPSSVTRDSWKGTRTTSKVDSGFWNKLKSATRKKSSFFKSDREKKG